MTINDRQIDLTMDGRLGNHFSFISDPSEKAKRKLFSKHYSAHYHHIPLVPGLTRSSTLPWHSKIIHNLNHADTKYKRSYGDALSDDYGTTLRITTDNRIMLMGKREYNVYVLEEFFMETLGRIPYSSTSRCMECNKTSIDTVKNDWQWKVCSSCSNRGTPWQFRDRRTL